LTCKKRREETMVAKRGKKPVNKKVKNLRAKGLSARQAKGVKGGAFEVTDYGFGVSMPVTTSRSDGGGSTVGKKRQ
jgi:hypothetical protein